MSYVVNFVKFRISCDAEPDDQFDIRDIKLKYIDDIVIHGVVVDCETGRPIPCALVKVFLVDEDNGYYGKRRPCKNRCPGLDSDCAYHTYTDECGQYLFNIPYEWKGKEIVIKAVKTNRECICECEE